MHPALRKGPLFTTPPFSTYLQNTPISFPAYGPEAVINLFPVLVDRV